MASKNGMKAENRPIGSPYPSMADAAKEYWTLFADELSEELTRKKRPIFRAFCEAWSDYDIAVERVLAEGEMITTPNGLTMKSPWLTMLEQRREFIRKTSVDLIGRPKVPDEKPAAKPSTPADKYLALLRGGHQ